MLINPVKGTHDIIGEDAAKFKEISFVCSLLAYQNCFEEIYVPIMEHTSLYSRSVGQSSDIVRKEMYSFEDKGGRSITLRPEFTAGIIRSVVSNKLYATRDLPLKLFYSGPCFRYDRPQAGRYRQFYQFGVECIGNTSYYLDCEVINLGYRMLNHLKINNIIVEINFLGDGDSKKKYIEELRNYFSSKIENMCEDCKQRLLINPLRILDCKNENDQKIIDGAPKMSDFLSDEEQIYFKNIISTLEELDVKYCVSNRLVRGLDYYSGVVWEYHVVSSENEDIGALGGGGHYKNLVKEIGGPDLEGVGLSLGLERLLHTINTNKIFPSIRDGADFTFLPMNEDLCECIYPLCEKLKDLNMRVDMIYHPKSIGSMIKTAIKRGSKFVIIVGEEEYEKEQVVIKNLATQEQTTVFIEDLDSVMTNLLYENYMSVKKES